MFSGLRSEDCATVRWHEIDFEKGTLHRPSPKGGADAAFTIPLSTPALEVLRARPRTPGTDLVFPVLSNSGKLVPLVERRFAGEGRDRGPHTLRRTFATACGEVGVPLHEVALLLNHKKRKTTVTERYVTPQLEALREKVERVGAFLSEKMRS